MEENSSSVGEIPGFAYLMALVIRFKKYFA
jgi:hypothetical protein